MVRANALEEIAHAFIKALETLDLNEMIQLRSPDCVQRIYPKSMGYPEMNNASYRAAYEAVLPYFHELKAIIHCLITDETSNKIVMHASSTAKTIIGPYDNEYMFILHVGEDGTRIRMIEEYVDSFKAKEQNPRLRAAITALKKEKASA